MRTIDMLDDGPDMAAVREAVTDPAVKGIWIVPTYANPTGAVVSEAVAAELAALETAAPDFRIIWDNAYAVHHLTEERTKTADIVGLCAASGNPDRPFVLASTSKITFAGSGVSFFVWHQLRDRPFPDTQYQSGLYFCGAKSTSDDAGSRCAQSGYYARDAAKSAPLRAFKFPFVAYAKNGRVKVWGRTADSAAHSVAIRRKVSGKWRTVKSVKAGSSASLNVRNFTLFPCLATAWSISSTTCSLLIHPCGWNTRQNTPCFSTVMSRAACMSRTVCGLFGCCRCCASQSLGTTQGNSQQSRLMTYGYG